QAFGGPGVAFCCRGVRPPIETELPAWDWICRGNSAACRFVPAMAAVLLFPGTKECASTRHLSGRCYTQRPPERLQQLRWSHGHQQHLEPQKLIADPEGIGGHDDDRDAASFSFARKLGSSSVWQRCIGQPQVEAVVREEDMPRRKRGSRINLV